MDREAMLDDLVEKMRADIARLTRERDALLELLRKLRPFPAAFMPKSDILKEVDAALAEEKKP